MSVKGSWKRKDQTTRREQDLRDAYAHGGMTFATFERKYKDLRRRGLITRSGKSVRHR